MAWLRYFKRRRKEGELDEEIESYLRIAIEDSMARGMNRADAEAAARRKFGNTTLVREKVRDMNTIHWLEDCWHDVRHALRLVRLNPAFFAVATLSLALGIGANTAIFQLLNAVRLRTLPVSQPGQLAELEIADNDHCCSGNFSTRRPNFTYGQWEQIRDHQQAFSGIFGFADARFNLAGGGEVRFAEGLFVTGDFFRTLGVNPALGRVLTVEDDRPGCGSPNAVISYPFWQREFGGNANAVGRTVSLNNHPFEIAGVSSPDFFGVEVGRSFEIAVPTCAEGILGGERNRLTRRDAWWLAIIGRLKPEFTVARTGAQVEAISNRVFEPTVPQGYLPEDAKWYTQYKLTAKPAATGVSSLRRRYEDPLWLLLGIAGAVLLIACANLANLMLARASVREREMAVRVAIGAGRGRLVRQMLAECALLTLAGTAAGALLAQWLSRYLVGFLSTRNSKLFLDLGIDWRMLAFTSAVAIVTCLLFGVAPAMRAASTTPGVAMRASGRSATADRSRFGMRRVLVVVQVALSLVLLSGALLFGRSLRNLTTQDAGLNQEGLLIARVGTANLRLPKERRVAFFEDQLKRIRAIPGVEQASTASIVQLSGSGWNPQVEVVGIPTPKDRRSPWFNAVGSRYFETMGTPLIAGRGFNERDTVASTEVAIVTQKFQEVFLNGADPIGKQFRMITGPGEDKHFYEIVGLVKDSKYANLQDKIDPLVFVASTQDRDPGQGLNFLVRSRLPMGQLTAAVKAAILEENAGTVLQFQVFKTQVEESLLRERLMATLSGFFGLLAGILASVGLYGVISYMVARRKNEIGIRVALGAGRIDILQLVIREATVLLAAGLAIGVAITASGARVTKSLLYGLDAHDPLTIAMAAALLAGVSLFASWMPAYRASRLDPMQSLREE